MSLLANEKHQLWLVVKVQEKKKLLSEAVDRRTENRLDLKKEKTKKEVRDCRTCICVLFECVSVCGQCSEAFFLNTNRMASSSLSPVARCAVADWSERKAEGVGCVDTMCGHSTPRQHLV